MCGHLNNASTSLDLCRHLHLQQNLQRAQTCTVARSSWSEEHGCLETIFCSFSFFFMHCNLGGGGGPNMALLSGPILYFHHSDVQGGCWSYFTHT
jgi:hypothetical protein